MNWKRIIGAGLLVWVTSIIFGFLTCGWLFNWVYTISPLIWKSAEEMTKNLIWMNLMSLVPAMLFTLVFAILYKGIPGKGVKKGMIYGVLVWFVSSFGGLLAMPFYMTISFVVVFYWIIQALFLNLIIGAIVGKIYRE